MTVQRLMRARVQGGALLPASANGGNAGAEAPARATLRLGGLLAGTGLLTPDGYRPVEHLRRGDLVATLMGRGSMFAPIVWVGRRRVLAAIDHQVLDIPVRVRRHAIANDMPQRDVHLAPDHAVYIDGSLFLVRHLINGATLLREVPRVGPQYWAIQLERHDIVLADGLPVETLQDMAARASYTEVSGPRLQVVGAGVC
jgi:hypothetical protein